METFAKLLGSLLILVYHCFDRIVILGHRPLLTHPENIVHFFHDLHQVSTISKEVLRQRTNDYHRWVEAFAKKHHIPLQWAEKGVRKEDYVRPHLRRLERQNQFGVCIILKSMERGPSFRSAVPRFPVDDPHYRILARQRSRYTQSYFYIRDELLGPSALGVGSFLPLFHHLLPQRSSLHRTRTAARGRGVPQGRQRFPRGGRCPSPTGGSRPPPPPDHSSAARSLDWGGRAEVFPEGPSGPQSHSPLLPAASRIRSQLRRNFTIPKLFERSRDLGCSASRP